MPSATISIDGDFSLLEKQFAAAIKRGETLFSKNFLRGSSFKEPLGSISASANEFGKSMAAANARVIAFGASAGLIYQVSQAIKELVSSTIEVNKSLTELNTLFNKSKQELASFSREIFDIAKNTGQTFAEVASGATELARQGLGATETLTRLKDASILARQSGLSLEDSVEALTAAINSFGKSALTSTEIINKFANVDASFAVSSKDLAEALKRVGSTAEDAGVSIDQLIGLVTAAQQTTSRGGAVIGNALKTIFTRIERPQVISQLEELGIVVKNTSGNLLSSSEILKNFAGSFNTASESQQSYLAELVGSVYQINILKALLGDLAKNYSITDQATRKSTEAQDEAIKRNEEYNKSLSATLNRIKENFRQAGGRIGDLTIAPLIQKVGNITDLLLQENDPDGIGNKLAEGILKGIGNFISGPGLALLGVIALKLTSNFTKFANEAAEDFLGLNKFTKEQKDLQSKLNEVLSTQPVLLDAILKKSLSQVEIDKTLLSLAQQRLKVESSLSSATSSAASNLLRSGALGYNKKTGSLQAGTVPNFASKSGYGPLYEAIERERRSGTPESSIKIGQDSKLKSPLNPYGLGVYNTQDEPLGLKQGIEKSISVGINPKFHGVGVVPNYADSPSRFRPFTPVETRRKFEEVFNENLIKARVGDLGLGEISKLTKELTESFKLTAQGAKVLKTSLETAAKFFNQRQDRLPKSPNLGIYGKEEFIFDPPKQTTFSNLLEKTSGSFNTSSILNAFTQMTPGEKERLQREYNKKANDLLNIPNSKNLENSENLSFTYLPKEQFNKIKVSESIAARKVAERAALEERQTTASKLLQNGQFGTSFLQEQFSFKNSNINQLGGSGVINNLIKQFSENISSGKTESSNEEVLKFKNIVKSNVVALGGSVDDLTKVNRIINDIVPLSQKLKSEYDRNVKVKEEALLNRQIASASSFSGFFSKQGRADIAALKNNNPEAYRGARAALNEKISRAGIAASIGIPIVAGIGSELIGDDTITKRGLSASLQGAGNIASFAALGTIFGPGGVAAGAGLGLITELPKIFKSFTDDLPDLVRNLELTKEQITKNSENLRNYVSLEEKLNNVRGLNESQINKIQKQRDKAFSVLSLEDRQNILGSNGFNIQEYLVKREEQNDQLEKALSLRTLIGSSNRRSIDDVSSLRTGKEGEESFFLNSELALRNAREQIIKDSKPIFEGRSLIQNIDPRKLVPEQRVFTPEALKISDTLNKFLPAIFSRDGKTLSEQPENIVNQFREDLVNLLEDKDTTKLLNKLLEFIPNSSVAGREARAGLTRNQQTSPDFFRALISRFLNDSFTRSFTSDLNKQREISQRNIVTTTKTVSDFTSLLFKAKEALNTFSVSLESSNKSVLQDLNFQDNINDINTKSFIDKQENFVGPRTLINLRGRAEESKIDSQRIIEQTKINQAFASEINSIINDNVSKSLEDSVRKVLSTSSDATPEIESSKKIVFDKILETKPFIEFNEKIQKALSSGNLDNVQKELERFDKFLTDQNSGVIKRINEFSTSPKAAETKQLIEGVSSSIREASLRREQSNQLLGTRIDQEKTLETLKRVADLNLANIQKQLSIGGGAKNIFDNPNSFKSIIEDSGFLSSRGDILGSSQLRGRGNFQIAETLQSLGVDIRGNNNELFDSLVSDLTNTLEKIFNDLGLQSNIPVSEIATNQLKNQFKTESDQETLISQQKSLISTLTQTNNSLDSFIALAKNEGLLISSKSIDDLSSALRGNAPGSSPSRSSLLNASENPREVASVVSSAVKEPLSQVFKDGLKSAGLLDRSVTVSGGNIRDRAPFSSSRRGAIEEASLLSEIDKNKGLSQGGLNRLFTTSNSPFAQDFDRSALEFTKRLASERSKTEESILELSKDLEQSRFYNNTLIQEESKILERLNKGEISLFTAVKNIRVERERTLSILAKEAFLSDRISGEDYKRQLNREADSKIANNTFGLRDAGKLFGAELTAYNKQDLFGNIKDGAIDTARTIKSEFSSAFKDFATGAKSAGEAFQSFGLGILNKVGDIVSQISTSLLFSAIGSGIGSVFGPKTGAGFNKITSKNSGGIIQKYSKGGKVKGGSGVKDDVPALLTEGEFVIKRSAVEAIGENILNDLNKGTVPYGKGNSSAGTNFDPGANAKTIISGNENSFSGIFKNAFAYNDGKRPTGGYFNVDRQLSSIGQTDDSNPANRLKFAREQDLINYLNERKAYDSNRRLTLRNFNRGQRNGLIAAYLQAGIAIGAVAVGSLFKGGPKGIQSNDYDFNQDYNANFGNYASLGGLATSGGFKRYAGGGHVFGGDSPSDRIPSLLTGGEFVIRKSSVDKYGSNFFNNINSGRINRQNITGYQYGGLVGSSPSTEKLIDGNKEFLSSLSKFDKLISKFDSIFGAKGNGQAANTNIYNFSISVNVTKEGNISAENTQSKSGNENDDQINSKKLAELIKQSTLETIIREKKNGGLLAPDT